MIELMRTIWMDNGSPLEPGLVPLVFEKELRRRFPDGRFGDDLIWREFQATAGYHGVENTVVQYPEKPTPVLPSDAADRKNIPIARGCLDYFPAALAAVAELSRIGNEQHNPGEPMHHARGKSGDHADCVIRHLMDRGALDADGIRHSAKAAWRALALLQEELEAEGAPLARGARR